MTEPITTTSKGMLLICPDCKGAGFEPDYCPIEGKCCGATECNVCQGSGYVYVTPCPWEDAPERPAPSFMRPYSNPFNAAGDDDGSDPFADD